MAWHLVALSTLLLLLFTTLSLFSYRLTRVLDPHRPKARVSHRDPGRHLLIVLGSGGHTAEMLAMLDRTVSPSPRGWHRYTRRTWVVGAGDAISAARAHAFEASIAAGVGSATTMTMTRSGDSGYAVEVVPRARAIHQPVWTAPWSSLRCALACARILLAGGGQGFPDLILCNGPATATILVFTSVVLRLFNVRGCATRGKMRTVYVESWARVKTLSLSGWLLSRVVDRFLVQWPQLEKVGGRAEYIGVLV